MPTRPTQLQVTTTTTAWVAGAERLDRAFLPALSALSALRDQIADGFRSSSLGGDGRGGGELTPTEAAAHARWRTTDLERRAVRCYVAIDRAFQSMANVLDEISAQEPSTQHTMNPADNESDGFCVNCARHGVQSVVESAARCEPCATYRRRHEGTDRPLGLVVAHARRRILTYDRRHRAALLERGVRA